MGITLRRAGCLRSQGRPGVRDPHGTISNHIGAFEARWRTTVGRTPAAEPIPAGQSANLLVD